MPPHRGSGFDSRGSGFDSYTSEKKSSQIAWKSKPDPDESKPDPDGEELATSRMVRIASAQLFHGERSIVIVHRGQEYRLHITRADKLILTK